MGKPKRSHPKSKYEEETVIIKDELLKEMSKGGLLIAFGVKRRQGEVHLEFYFERLLLMGERAYSHRDIEVQPDGTYDSGSMIGSENIKAQLKRLGVIE